MKKLLLFWSAAAMLLGSSCSESGFDEAGKTPGTELVRMYVSDETTEAEANPASRAYFADGYKIAWEAGDQVAIVSGTPYTVQQDGSGRWYVELPSAESYTVYYPAKCLGTEINGTLAFNMLVTQEYRSGSFDPKALPARAVAKPGEKLVFKYMCSLLKITLRGTEAERVSKIEVIAKGGEKISQYAQIAYSGEDAYLVPVTGAFASLTKNYVELTASEGVSLNETGVDFYLAINPTTFSNGFYVKTTLSDGRQMIKTGGVGQTARRGRILAMPALAFVETDTASPVLYSTDNSNWQPWKYAADGTTPATLAYPASQKLYFKDNANATAPGLKPAHLQYLSVNFIKNHYLTGESATAAEESPIGLDFSQASYESTTLPADIFTYSNEEKFNNSLTYLSLPKNIAKVESRAFSRTQVLRTIILPKSVTELANQAFWVTRGVHDIYCYAAVPPTLSGTVFAYIGWANPASVRVHCPAASLEAYQSTWGADYWLKNRTTLVGDL